MNILHIINGFVSSKLYKAFVEHLSVNIDEQTVFVPIRSSNQKGKNSITLANVKIIYSFVVTKLIYRVLFFLKISKTINNLQKTIDVKEFDIIHAHTLFSDGAVAYELYRQYGIPYIVTLRNTDLNEFFKYLFYLRPLGIKILMAAKNIVFLSEAYQNRLLQNYIHKSLHDSLRNKSLIIPNGIDDFWLQNINDEKKRLDTTIKLLFTGEIRKNKNILGVIDAIASIDNVNIEYTIVGKGLNDEESYLKVIEERIKGNDNINLLPVVSKEELLCYYRDADIFIMPSFTETFGLVYAEALSQGLPVIYSSGEGFDKVFDEGIVGLSVKSNDIDDIAHGINELISNYSEIQKNCASSAKKFSWESIAEVYLHNYSDINKDGNAN